LLLASASAAVAQEVQPIVSNDYLQLIRPDRPQRPYLDTAHSLLYSPLRLRGPYDFRPTADIRIRGQQVWIKPARPRTLRITGTYGASVDIKTVNRLPALQDQYVQGRPVNGTTAWQGPETGQLFSYGPDINTLAYDGQPYAYDANGHLVPKGNSNLAGAHAYANKLFRTGRLFDQSLSLQLRYLYFKGQPLVLRTRIGRSSEDLVIPDNTNQARSLALQLSIPYRNYTIIVGYNAEGQRFSRSNRGGLLNRAYQSALLTPVSFDNSQGDRINTGQRSYNALADNPFFLLHAPAQPLVQSDRTGLLSIENKIGRLKVKLTQSLEQVKQDGAEGYAQGTARFPGGVWTDRSKTDDNYQARINADYTTNYDGDLNISTTLSGNYLWSYNRSSIDYNPGLHYRYRRSASDASINYQARYIKANDLDLSVRVGNKLYASSTTSKNAFFLPDAALSLTVNNLFDSYKWSVRVQASVNRFNEEASVSTSFAQSSLMRYGVADALSFFPVTEVNGFSGLAPIRHREQTISIELTHNMNFNLRGELFDRSVHDDVFAIAQNNELQLKNLADHRTRGFELSASMAHRFGKISYTEGLSFFTSRSRVTAVHEGYEGRPVAGFSDVYKGLVAGDQLGAIMGSSYVRNAAGQVVIGTDGFPLKNAQPAVIGHTNPDFIIKSNHALSWKSWNLNLDIELDKGGQAWNGTQALLDYYGRSATTGAQRNLQNFVFAGVRTDGHTNDIPVRFYDPSLPVEQNRWTRNGPGGIAEEYIRKADCIRLHTLGLAYKLTAKKYIQSVTFNIYVQNIFLWSATPGLNSNRLLYDAAGTEGLDFFNLPSTKTFGFHTSIQF